MNPTTWRARCRAELLQAYPGWIQAGALYQKVKGDIPLHAAMRRYVSGMRKLAATGDKARWFIFREYLHLLDLEREDQHVKIKYVTALCAKPLKCVFCGNDFLPIRSTPEKRSRACSRQCASKERERNRADRRQPSYRLPKTDPNQHSKVQ